MQGITRLRLDTLPLLLNSELHTSLLWLSMYSAAIAPVSPNCSCATWCQWLPTICSSGSPAPLIARADTCLLKVLGMYENPVNGASPAAAGALRASHPLLSATSHPSTSILTLAPRLWAPSCTNRGHV